MTSPVVIDDLKAPKLTPLQRQVLDHFEKRPVDLEPERLIEDAVSRTGFTDFGPPDFRPRLDAHVAAINADAGNTNLNRLTLRNRIARLLSSHLLLTDLLNRYPEIHDIELKRPIIVVGLPRSGTTHLVMQANWESWRRDNDLLATFRSANAYFAWADAISKELIHTKQRGGFPAQSSPVPTVVVDDELTLRVGERELVLLATPGGETTDSLVVWLPGDEICLCGNVFGALFGHIPNLVTMRGDRYRDALTVIESVEAVRELSPSVLLTGHFDPITGKDRIREEFTRLRDAVAYLHDHTVAGMNAGKDVHTLMNEVTLPPDLQVGEGYGMVRWNVRAIWENYAGWFRHRSTTELYAVAPEDFSGEIVALAGADAIVGRARKALADRAPVRAIRLAETVRHVEPHHDGAKHVLRAAHEHLLEASTNFWESARLHKEIADLT